MACMRLLKYVFNIIDCGLCVAYRCFTVAISEGARPFSTEKTGPPTGDFTQQPVNPFTAAASVRSHIIQSRETGPNTIFATHIRSAIHSSRVSMAVFYRNYRRTMLHVLNF